MVVAWAAGWGMYLGVTWTFPLIVVVVVRPLIVSYRMIKKGICRNRGRQPPAGLTPCCLYNAIISSFSFWRFSAPLYFVCSFLISGCSRCMAIIDFVLFTVSGVSRSMMMTVSRAIAIA